MGIYEFSDEHLEKFCEKLERECCTGIIGFFGFCESDDVHSGSCLECWKNAFKRFEVKNPCSLYVDPLKSCQALKDREKELNRE